MARLTRPAQRVDRLQKRQTNIQQQDEKNKISLLCQGIKKCWRLNDVSHSSQCNDGLPDLSWITASTSNNWKIWAGWQFYFETFGRFCCLDCFWSQSFDQDFRHFIILAMVSHFRSLLISLPATLACFMLFLSVVGLFTNFWPLLLLSTAFWPFC